MAEETITQELLNERFEYRDGNLYWKVDLGGRVKIGTLAGCATKKGYRLISVNDEMYKSHRLIFFMHYGYFTDKIIRIDRDKTNNRIENLKGSMKGDPVEPKPRSKPTSSTKTKTIKRDGSPKTIEKQIAFGYRTVSWYKEDNKWHIR